MLKAFMTLFRGNAAAAAQDLHDRNALTILDQQIRDATSGVDRAKRALALAIAQDQQEGKRLDATKARILDLETRAIAALEGKREDLARQAAETIAALEADREPAVAARDLFADEISKLKRHVADAELRLSELDRGRRLARAAEAVRDVRRGRVEPSQPHQATMQDAETTLKRLRERQIEARAADEALDALEVSIAPSAIAERLAENGFGPRLRVTADDVLERLRANTAQPVRLIANS